jgi:microcystin-dependent protein
MDQYMSEIRLMAFNFPPSGWALCNGQTLPINQNQALFSLLGTYYGGDGVRNFALPNLQGRVPIGTQGNYVIGQIGGEATHTLQLAELPQHTHLAQGTTSTPDAPIAANSFLAQVANMYGPASSLTPVIAGTIGNAGGSQPHDNSQPYLTVAFCIALQGVYPTRN